MNIEKSKLKASLDTRERHSTQQEEQELRLGSLKKPERLMDQAEVGFA